MKRGRYLIIKMLLFVFVFSSVVFGINRQSPIPAIAGILVGMGVISFIKLFSPQKSDERLDSIHQKSTQAAFKILLPITGTASLALFSLGKERFFYLYSIGIILSYITCLGLVIYFLSYFYYNKKYGG